MNVQIEQVKHKVKDPEKLVNALNKLDELVGQPNIKNAIKRQTSYLLQKMDKGELSLKMLNTVLMGAPGIGKTNIGIVLAEIWHQMGFLKPQPKLPLSLFKIDHNTLQIYLFFIIVVGSMGYKIVESLYEKWGLYFIIGVVIGIGLFIYLYKDFMMETMFNESIVITSRSDFIGSYLGTTEKKTEDLLYSHLGKVVFIDEAYSLCSGPQDMYGMECLTALNRFMSEHENEIVIIFAGYEDLLNNTIFKYQPGLNRRCMWKFKCESYDGDELFKIFQLQLGKEKYQCAKRDLYKIKEVITEYKDNFKYMGGDMQKLAFFSQLNHKSDDNDITIHDVKAGIQELLKN